MDATLQLDEGMPIKVLQLDYSFTQYTDDTGRPTGNPTGGMINMVVESTTDTQLLDWMLIPAGTKNGRVEMTIKTNRKTIEFKDAFCIQFSESFSHMGGDEPISISFTLSAAEITIDGISFVTRRQT